MEFMEWIVYLSVPSGFIKENICEKVFDRKFLVLSVCSHLQFAVFQGSQVYLGDLSYMITRFAWEIVHTVSYFFFPLVVAFYLPPWVSEI